MARSTSRFLSVTLVISLFGPLASVAFGSQCQIVMTYEPGGTYLGVSCKNPCAAGCTIWWTDVDDPTQGPGEKGFCYCIGSPPTEPSDCHGAVTEYENGARDLACEGSCSGVQSCQIDVGVTFSGLFKISCACKN